MTIKSMIRKVHDPFHDPKVHDPQNPVTRKAHDP